MGDFQERIKTIASREPCLNLMVDENVISFDIVKLCTKVSANIEIRRGVELFIRTIFPEPREIVEIVDTDFGKRTADVKIERLENFIVHFMEFSTKEEMLPDCLHWGKYLKTQPRKFARGGADDGNANGIDSATTRFREQRLAEY